VAPAARRAAGSRAAAAAVVPADRPARLSGQRIGGGRSTGAALHYPALAAAPDSTGKTARRIAGPLRRLAASRSAAAGARRRPRLAADLSEPRVGLALAGVECAPPATPPRGAFRPGRGLRLGRPGPARAGPSPVAPLAAAAVFGVRCAPTPTPARGSSSSPACRLTHHALAYNPPPLAPCPTPCPLAGFARVALAPWSSDRSVRSGGDPQAVVARPPVPRALAKARARPAAGWGRCRQRAARQDSRWRAHGLLSPHLLPPPPQARPARVPAAAPGLEAGEL
jgi:hypothetical protein